MADQEAQLHRFYRARRPPERSREADEQLREEQSTQSDEVLHEADVLIATMHCSSPDASSIAADGAAETVPGPYTMGAPPMDAALPRSDCS